MEKVKGGIFNNVFLYIDFASMYIVSKYSKYSRGTMVEYIETFSKNVEREAYAERERKYGARGASKGIAALSSPIFEGFSGLKPHKSVRLAGSNRAENTVGIEERGVETSVPAAGKDDWGRGKESGAR